MVNQYSEPLLVQVAVSPSVLPGQFARSSILGVDQQVAQGIGTSGQDHDATFFGVQLGQFVPSGILKEESDDQVKMQQVGIA